MAWHTVRGRTAPADPLEMSLNVEKCQRAPVHPPHPDDPRPDIYWISLMSAIKPGLYSSASSSPSRCRLAALAAAGAAPFRHGCRHAQFA